MTLSKTKLLKKAAALKKKLLQKSNCCDKGVTLKKCGEVTSPKIMLSWKVTKYARRESPFENKKSKLNYWLRLTEFVFPESFPHPDKDSWGISYEYLSGQPESTKEEITRQCLCHTIFGYF